MPYAPGTLLWVKLEGYPWWPCQVLEDSYLDPTIVPEGVAEPIPIMYFGSNDLGVITGNESATDVSCLFDPSDEAKCLDCASDATLASALETATQTYNDAVNAAAGAEQSSDDDEDDHNEGGEGADDLLMGGQRGESEDRRAQRKKDKKDKKKDKKDKKKDKKDKKHRSRDEADDDGHGGRKSSSKKERHETTTTERREKRHRSEKDKKKRSSGGDNDGYDYANEDDYGVDDHKPIRLPKMDVSDDILVQLKETLEQAVEDQNHLVVRDCLSDLSNINVTFDQLVSTGVGRAVGLVCDLSTNKGWGEVFAPLQAWAGAIVRYWFAQIPDRHKGQLIDADAVERASIASNDDLGSQHGEQNEFNQLDALGLQIEKAFTNEEVMTAGSNSAAELALEIQLAIEALDSDHKAQRGAEAISNLNKPDHSELRLALLRGTLAVKDFVADPIQYGLNKAERDRLEEQAHVAEKAMDITGERERIVHAIAVAEVVEK